MTRDTVSVRLLTEVVQAIEEVAVVAGVSKSTVVNVLVAASMWHAQRMAKGAVAAPPAKRRTKK